MDDLSTADAVSLAERFGVEIHDREADQVRATANEILNSVDGVFEDAISGGGPDTAERTWHSPEKNPHNALVTECSVPPTDEDGPLSDRTVGVKDIIAVAGVPMTCGSEVFEEFVPAADATVIRRLREAGATVTAKTNLDELAASGRGTTGASGRISNPYENDRTAGGSSGGSAVAVATQHVDVALGTDTGGSVRIPACYCGVVGVKPTYGLVPNTGVVEAAYTLDHVGTVARTIEDTALSLEALVGADPADAATMQAAGRDNYRVGGYAEAVAEPATPDTLRVGVVTEGFGDQVVDPVAERTRAVVDALADAGSTVRHVSVPGFRQSRDIFSLINAVELATHWRAGTLNYRRGGRRETYLRSDLARHARDASGALGPFLKAKLVAGGRLIDAHHGRSYTGAQAARTTLRAQVDDALADVDVLVTPTMPDVPPLLEDAADPGYAYGYNTRIANVTRLPAITVPNGTVDGLPIGLQLIGDAFREDQLFDAATTLRPYLGETPAPA